MAATIRPLLVAVGDHARTLGIFETVITHQPSSAPTGNGLCYSLWVQRVAAASSGLAASSASVTLIGTVYKSMLGQPEDEIDASIIDAVDALFTEYVGDFELGGRVREADVRGTEGTPPARETGYLTQDSTQFRIATLVIPLIVNDSWTETP